MLKRKSARPAIRRGRNSEHHLRSFVYCLFSYLSSVIVITYGGPAPLHTLNATSPGSRVEWEGDRLIRSIATGASFVLAIASIVLAMGLAGGGHGWGAPVLFSWLLVILNPVAVTRALGPVDTHSLGQRADIILLAIAACADALLIADAWGPEFEHFQSAVDNSWPWVAAWMCLWLLWQILVVVSFFRRL
jgi:hypothetical protein